MTLPLPSGRCMCLVHSYRYHPHCMHEHPNTACPPSPHKKMNLSAFSVTVVGRQAAAWTTDAFQHCCLWPKPVLLFRMVFLWFDLGPSDQACFDHFMAVSPLRLWVLETLGFSVWRCRRRFPVSCKVCTFRRAPLGPRGLAESVFRLADLHDGDDVCFAQREQNCLLHCRNLCRVSDNLFRCIGMASGMTPERVETS